jgi:hypothetical protein
VVEVTPQARFEGDIADWSDRRTTLGARTDRVRFAVQPFERAESATSRQVCLDVWSWDSQRALDVRLLIKYLPAHEAVPAPTPVQAAAKSGAG